MKRCQAGEWEALRFLLPDDPVVYVDIGAAEPDECSNTWGFYEAGGYGLLVEPRVELHGLLRAKRPRDRLAGDAAWDAAGELPLRMAGGCSSLRPDWPIGNAPSRTVTTRPTQEILDGYPAIRDACRFCSIDTEGTEAHVLRGIDWTRFRPEVVMVEYIEFDPRGPGRDLSHEWVHYLTDHGYVEVVRSWLNILFGVPSVVARWQAGQHVVRHPEAVYFPRGAR